MTSLFDLQKRLLRHEQGHDWCWSDKVSAEAVAELRSIAQELCSTEAPEAFHDSPSKLIESATYKVFALQRLEACAALVVDGMPMLATEALSDALQAINWLLGGSTVAMLTAEDELRLIADYLDYCSYGNFTTSLEGYTNGNDGRAETTA